MFLSNLNQEQKVKFLELAYKVANIDVSYDKAEINLIKKYRKECEIDVIPSGSNVDDLIRYFATENVAAQKIVYFEIMGIVFADTKIAEKEQDVIAKMEANFGIDDEELTKLKEIAQQLEQSYRAAVAIIE